MLKKLYTDEKCKRIDEYAIFIPHVLHQNIEFKSIETPTNILEKEGFEVKLNFNITVLEKLI
jgi:hypothetical protein